VTTCNEVAIRFSRDDDTAMVISTTDELTLNHNERHAAVGIIVSFAKTSDIRMADATSSPNSTTIASLASAQ